MKSTFRAQLILVLFLFSFIFKSDGSASMPVKPSVSDNVSPVPLTNVEVHKKVDYSSFKDLGLQKDGIAAVFEGNKVELSLPIYTKHNRYFIPFTELVDKINGNYVQDGDKLSVQINGHDIILDIKSNTFSKNSKEYKLKKEAEVSGEIVYLSMFDIANIFDLKTVWDYKTKTISFFNDRDRIVQKQASSSQKIAFIRIEDVVASPVYRYGSSETLEKLRIMSDYLYSKNIPFHIAWIPRYIDPRPSSKDDTDPSKVYSIYNSDFIYTLDYMVNRGAIIGLHGYTHQYGNSASVDGTEFHSYNGDGIPPDDQYAKDRINMAIQAAKELDIPFSFFEAPHYKISNANLKVVEANFEYMYQRHPSNYGKVIKINNNGKVTKYIPTPLDYLDGKGQLNNMLKKINNLSPSTLASLFYHPNIEFDDIKISKDSSGYHNYTYLETSALHQMVKAFEDKGYRFGAIRELQ